ncbi:hypothetical protein O181_003494 [Austropuccinia psidii MF-1]|uniref:Uncharacterized protein n=1 Tax=Austropuccinia psidii MF-1 TaxID=1389203 RepID=A0A9Q3GDX3_9BASI|nr:hypothetical protein [Austropuccinia psidii MF-1]
MIRGLCAYGLEFEEPDGFTHYWFILIPALELVYKTSIHSSTGKTPSILEKGWNPRLLYDTLKLDLAVIQPTESSCKIILDKSRHHANRFMKDCLKYEKGRWERIQKQPNFKIGYLVLVSTLKFSNIKEPKTLNNCFSGTFTIGALHSPNSVQVQLTVKLTNKHPAFPVSLIETYSSSDKESFSLRDKHCLVIIPLEEGEEKKIVKVLKERQGIPCGVQKPNSRRSMATW